MSTNDVVGYGGADVIRENHGDWLVTCTANVVNGQKRGLCMITQEQIQKESRQRVLAIELHARENGAKGSVVLPFGLALQRGADLQIDDDWPSRPHTFRTALPIGCVIDVDFDDLTVSTLKSGEALKIVAGTADTGQDIRFVVSLKGFAAAFARMEDLMALDGRR